MTTPRRLLEEGTEFERELLASAQLDVGTDAGRKRVALATAAAILSATTSTTTAAAGASVGGATTVALAKWAGVVVVTLGVAGGSIEIARTLPSARAPTMSAPEAAVTAHSLAAGRAHPPPPVPEPSGDVNAAADPSPPVHAAGAPPVTTAALASPLATTRPKETPSIPAQASGALSPSEPEPVSASFAIGSAPPPPDLQAEVSALGKARAALGQHDGPAALEQLDAYAIAFPKGLLADEATVLRIDALELRGEPAAAAALGRRYLSAHPTSPYGARVRTVIDAELNP